MSTSIPVVPTLAAPPRAVPAGIRMHVLNRQRLASSPMWTLPAACALLFAAIAQLPRGWHIAVVVLGASLLFMGLARTLPVLRGSLRTIFRMQHGSALLGRIVTCRIAIEGPSNDKPYAEFLRKCPAIIGAAQLSLGVGCALGLFVLPMAFGFILLILAFVAGLVARLFDPSMVDMGNVDLQEFIQFCVALIALCLFVSGLLFVWRKAKVPIADAYLRYEMAAERNPYTVERIKEALAQAAKIGLGAPLPKRSDTNIPLACKVEYRAEGETRNASAMANLSDQLNIAGFEPLIFHPRYPGEVDLFAGFPMGIRVRGGQWEAIGGFKAGVSVVFAAAAASFAAATLLYEAIVLGLSR